LLPAIDLVSIIVEVVHLRQASVPRALVENQIVQTHHIPRHAARRLIGQVEQELQTIRRRLSLPLALSAEALIDQCVQVSARTTSHN
jgi:hypothetical protein